MKRKSQKREEAVIRQNERAERTDAQQLDKLTREGHGSCREAKRLRGES